MMATSTRNPQPPAPTRPPLVEGDRLAAAEFAARYEQMPPGARARLINGVVFFKEGGMASPVNSPHARWSGRVGSWLGSFALRTPGVREGYDCTLDLGMLRMPQPDHLLWILEECGGRVRDDGRRLHG